MFVQAALLTVLTQAFSSEFTGSIYERLEMQIEFLFEIVYPVFLDYDFNAWWCDEEKGY